MFLCLPEALPGRELQWGLTEKPRLAASAPELGRLQLARSMACLFSGSRAEVVAVGLSQRGPSNLCSPSPAPNALIPRCDRDSFVSQGKGREHNGLLESQEPSLQNGFLGNREANYFFFSCILLGHFPPNQPILTADRQFAQFPKCPVESSFATPSKSFLLLYVPHLPK